jgi:hypothetical protein
MSKKDLLERLTWTDDDITVESEKKTNVAILTEDGKQVYHGNGETVKKSIQSFITLSSSIQALAGIDIMSLVPKATIDAIKERDPHPFLQAYSICHEGISAPTILGDTARPIHWTRAAIQSIKKTVLRGVKFFLGHNADNSTDDRESLGEVVWDGQKEIDGVLHHVVVGYFPDSTKVANQDICSQESEWSFSDVAGAWFAETLHKVTGIALSSSASDRPAFAGAIRLGMVQALDMESEQEKLNKEKIMDITTVPFGELVQEMKRRNTFPHQLFTLEDLKDDREFSKLITEKDELTRKLAIKDDEFKKLNDAKVAQERAMAMGTAKDRFVKVVDSMVLTPKQKQFVKNSFPTSMDDASDVAIQRLIASKLEDFKVAVQTFDIKDELPAQGTQEPSDSEDFTKAAANPLLEEDLQ